MASETQAELPIFQKSYDFAKWILAHTARFPKSHRFSLAVRIELLALEVVEKIYLARSQSLRRAMLQEIDSCLGRLRILLRLSYEMKLINAGSYEFGSKSLAAGTGLGLLS